MNIMKIVMNVRCSSYYLLPSRYVRAALHKLCSRELRVLQDYFKLLLKCSLSREFEKLHTLTHHNGESHVSTLKPRGRLQKP